MKPIPSDQGELSLHAWDQIAEAMQTGLVTFRTGEQLKLSGPAYVSLLKYVSALTASKPKKGLPLPDEFLRGLR